MAARTGVRSERAALACYDRHVDLPPACQSEIRREPVHLRLVIGAMRLWLVCTLLVACLATSSDATKIQMPGSVPAHVSLLSDEWVGSDGTWLVRVSTFSLLYSPSTPAQVRIYVGPEVKVLEGDLRRIVHPHLGSDGSDRGWGLRLRKKRDGPVNLQAFLLMKGPRPGDSYLYETRLGLHVQGDTVRMVSNDMVASIRTENGRRYRYGGSFPVTLEPDDVVTGTEAPDSRPRLLSDPIVRVPKKLLPAQTKVQVVASIGKTGRLLWLEPVLFRPPEPLWQAVVRAVQGYQFSPATLRGKPVTENLTFTIQLVAD